MFIFIFSAGVVLEEDASKRRDLCSTLYIRCTKCGHKYETKTSRRTGERGQSYDVNRRATYIMGELGHGQAAMADFCSVFNMPPPVASGNWSLHNNAIRKTSTTILREECIAAGKRLRENIMKDDSSIDKDQVLDIPVSFDGTWHHSGFSSTHGLGVVMSVDSGEVLDAVVLSKDCVECTRMQKEDPESDDYMIWEYHHFEGGFCDKNYEGPSTGIEQM